MKLSGNLLVPLAHVASITLRNPDRAVYDDAGQYVRFLGARPKSAYRLLIVLSCAFQLRLPHPADIIVDGRGELLPENLLPRAMAHLEALKAMVHDPHNLRHMAFPG